MCTLSSSFTQTQDLTIINRNGRYGLYLDDTLLDGSSARCPTFENEPLCSPRRKGAMLHLNIWGWFGLPSVGELGDEEDEEMGKLPVLDDNNEEDEEE